MSEATIEFVVVTRTVSVEVFVPVDSYRTGKGDDERIMTVDEINAYETGLTGEDAFQAVVESIGVAAPESIKQTCTVAFKLGLPSESDV